MLDLKDYYLLYSTFIRQRKLHATRPVIADGRIVRAKV